MPDEDQIINPDANEHKATLKSEETHNFEDFLIPEFPTALNEKLKDLIDDNPNKLMGCGG